MIYNKSHNLQHHLWMRERDIRPGRRHPVPQHFLYHVRNFYKSITPNISIQSIFAPKGVLRKFSPKGDLLLAFTHDQKSLIVYQYLGIGGALDLLYLQTKECITAADVCLNTYHIRQQLFNRLFDLNFKLPIITTENIGTRHYLNREFSIFLDDGNFVLLASMEGGSIFPSYLAYHYFTDLYDDTELYDYTFYLIDLRRGRITDTLKMGNDFIVLSHNHSVSVYERTLAILSTYRQCIDIVELNLETCKLVHLFTLGPFCSNVDRDRVIYHHRTNRFGFDPIIALPFTTLKQKILAFMYREIMELRPLHERQKKLKEFYKNFPLVERMIILKMQLIDSDHLLLRYDKRRNLIPSQSYNGSNTDTADKNFKMYVFYNISEQKVLRIFPTQSMEVLNMVRNYCDQFRNCHPVQLPWIASSPSNNISYRAAFDHALNTYAGGISEAAGLFNATLPLSSQSFSNSPYLDYSLFNYDDRFISSLERPRVTSLDPIRFWDRSTGLLKFRLYLEESNDARTTNCENFRNPRDLVTFICHPYEPFFISVQKILQYYVVNFHMYNPRTIVKHGQRELNRSTD